MNRSLDSREFKLILKPKIFQDLNEGIKKVQKIIDKEVDMLNGKFKPDSDLKQKFRRTYYLDTFNFRLKSKNFFLRVREDKESNKYDITLKCRHPDRYISSSYDLSSSIKKSTIKFEEDIIASHVSKFSISVNFEEDQEPEINNLEKLKTIFPGLHTQDLGDGILEKVNKFEAKEISVKLGKISYSNNNKDREDDDDEIKTFLNLWYSPKNKGKPVIVEFTYDYAAIKKKEEGKEQKKGKKKEKILIEEFPFSLVRNTYQFYNSLQNRKKIVDLKSSKTKTDFVYKYKP
ncbi:MAG TPA: hypothetical protein VHJ38_02175 [Nitrososphaeraceae archaeon]|nr:hypothetical protein [Nitrososphaeraceae archaeon]